jgi:carbon-monoxide dehydrogenase medium subunit/2-furoyl-CoA dehydrogenase FAD binding subunit
MKPAAFAYRRPDTIGEALAVLAEYGEECRVIAGGQSLGAMLNMRLVTPRVLLDVNRLKELDAIAEQPDALRIGAITRQSDVMRTPIAGKARLLQLALPHVGHYQTRNRGTIGGSIAHADPSAELPLALLVGGGSVELRSRRGSRHVEAEKFFVSNLTTQRRPEELLTAVHWPRTPAGSGEAFAEFATRSGDYALVAAACRVTLDAKGNVQGIRLGFSGVNDRPVLADTGTARGRKPDASLVREIADAAAAEIETVSDFHASAAFRSNLVKVLGAQVLTYAFRAAGAEKAHA